MSEIGFHKPRKEEETEEANQFNNDGAHEEYQVDLASLKFEGEIKMDLVMINIFSIYAATIPTH